MTRTLEAAPYWQLRAYCSEAQRWALALEHARAELARALQHQTGALRAHGFGDPPTFTLDDDTLTITVPDATA
jgi:hypothetical protein